MHPALSPCIVLVLLVPGGLPVGLRLFGTRSCCHRPTEQAHPGLFQASITPHTELGRTPQSSNFSPRHRAGTHGGLHIKPRSEPCSRSGGSLSLAASVLHFHCRGVRGPPTLGGNGFLRKVGSGRLCPITGARLESQILSSVSLQNPSISINATSNDTTQGHS